VAWKIESTIPTLAVPDLEAGISFYERLGCEVDWRWPDENPTHVGLMIGGGSLMLALCDPMVNADVYFIVDDVEACHADVLAGRSWELAHALGALANHPNGAPKRALQPPPEPEDRPYGLRDFTIVDPWGHQFSFGEATDE
jgi:catechol 2,3-dioxygenase-like lactoylglutathione lyase family enzyme